MTLGTRPDETAVGETAQGESDRKWGMAVGVIIRGQPVGRVGGFPKKPERRMMKIVQDIGLLAGYLLGCR